jgi:GH15 family glucan-1,4-alpha-glucosidase
MNGSSIPAIPIADYGLVGDTRAAAVVSNLGAIDWLCAPRFDGEPVFGRLVGGPEAGTFRIGPAGPVATVERRYSAETATLETRWSVEGGRLALRDAMVAEVAGRLLPATLLVRTLAAEGGPVEGVVEFNPRQGVAHRRPRTRGSKGSLVCDWGAQALSLGWDHEAEIEPGRPVALTVVPGRPLTWVLAVAHREPLVHVDPGAGAALATADEARWRAWAGEVDAHVPHRDAVVRSLITLRLLTYSPSGAPVAAPTTSLPEHPGGVRNWDYRFAWPRDASIGIGAFLGAGKIDEARSFLAWLLHASRLSRPRLPVLLTIDGRRARRERSLDGWPGYAGSTPVRIGNGAADQHQLDGYGWVLDAAWLLERAGHRLFSETWRAMAGFADLVARRWRAPDAGIWELRDAPAHNVHSKLMAWLALDRALRIGGSHRLPPARRRLWTGARAEIAADVTAHGYDESRMTYTRSYGSGELDAALLVLPQLGIEDPASPRVRGTIDAIRRELGAGGPLLYRYPPGHDGLPGTEGAFLPCSFWLVTALANTGRIDEAGQLFEDLLGLANPVGLYAEEMDPATGAHLGNFPQALTHAALVQAALALRDAAGAPTGSPGGISRAVRAAGRRPVRR